MSESTEEAWVYVQDKSDDESEEPSFEVIAPPHEDNECDELEEQKDLCAPQLETTLWWMLVGLVLTCLCLTVGVAQLSYSASLAERNNAAMAASQHEVSTLPRLPERLPQDRQPKVVSAPREIPSVLRDMHPKIPYGYSRKHRRAIIGETRSSLHRHEFPERTPRMVPDRSRMTARGANLANKQNTANAMHYPSLVTTDPSQPMEEEVRKVVQPKETPLPRKDQVVFHLTADTFEEFVANHTISIISFHGPWCPLCRQLAPRLDILRKTAAERKIPLQVATVDCHAQFQFCQQQNVSKFPTLLWYNANHEVKEYQEHGAFERIEQLIELLQSMKRLQSKKNEVALAEEHVMSDH